MEICVAGNSERLTQTLKSKSAKGCEGVQEEKEGRDDQDLGKAILALAELKVTESISTGTDQEKKIENMEKGCENQVIQEGPTLRVPLQDRTNLLMPNIGTDSKDQKKNLKGHWKRRARMHNTEKQEENVVFMEVLEGEKLKKEREENELKIHGGVDWLRDKKKN